MNAQNNSNCNCTQAITHYYDFIHEDRRHLIPGLILEHISACDHCRQQIENLQKTLSQSPQRGQSQEKKIVNKWLELHLLYAGKAVNCQAVKPFLPGLLDDEAVLRIPTPITAHVDSCPQCQNDLEKIRELNLGRKNLWQLGGVLADAAEQPYKIELAEADWSGLDVRTIERLRKTVIAIAARPDSGVITRYSLSETAEAAGAAVTVEAAADEETADVRQPVFVYQFRQQFRRIHFRSLLKPAIAAAVIMLAPAMFFYYYTSVAKASTLEEVYHAVEEVKNVYIARYDPNKTEPIQEEWVSRELNISVSKVGGRMFLHDMNKNLTTVKSLQTGEIKSIPMDSRRAAAFCRLASSHLGMMPFDSIKDLPAGAVWEDVTQQYPEIAVQNIEIYDLLWQTKTPDGTTILSKWRYFVDAGTHLPRRTEYYQQNFPEEKPDHLISINTFDYINAAEINTVFKLDDQLIH